VRRDVMSEEGKSPQILLPDWLQFNKLSAVDRFYFYVAKKLSIGMRTNEP
jgi:hypothetical protein